MQGKLQTIFFSRHSLAFAALILPSILCDAALVDLEKVSPTDFKATISLPLEGTQEPVEDSVTFSVDQPGVTVTSWQSNKRPHAENKEIFTVFLQSQAPELPSGTNLHLSYLRLPDNKPEHVIFALSPHTTLPLEPIAQAVKPPPSFAPFLPRQEQLPITKNALMEAPAKPSTYQHFRACLEIMHKKFLAISSLYATYTKTYATGLILIIAFLLGLLLGFTPYGYPLVPLARVAHVSRSSHIERAICIVGFCLCLAIVYDRALVGLLYGLGNLWFTIFLVIILGFSALSLVGLFQLPFTNLATKALAKIAQRSVACLFAGVTAGILAVPYAASGLALLFIIATPERGTAFYHELTRGLFGLGIGIALMIRARSRATELGIDTIASPWQLELKRLFGLMAFLLASYYLTLLMPFDAVLLLAGSIVFMLGIYYTRIVSASDSTRLRYYQYIMAVALIAIGTFAIGQAVKIHLLAA